MADQDTPNDMNDEFVDELLDVVARLQKDGAKNDDILATLRAMSPYAFR